MIYFSYCRQNSFCLAGKNLSAPYPINIQALLMIIFFSLSLDPILILSSSSFSLCADPLQYPSHHTHTQTSSAFLHFSSSPSFSTFLPNSQCSEVCGPGTQTRDVTCHIVNRAGWQDPQPVEHGCNESKRPRHTRRCNMGPCQHGYFWRVKPWKQVRVITMIIMILMFISKSQEH